MNFIIRLLLVLAFLVPPQFASAQFTDQRTWAPTTGGSANAQTVAIPNVSGPPLGVVFRFIPQFTNTGPATLNINGTGAKNIRKPSPAGPVALIGGELVATQIVEAMYDGTNIQLVSNLNATASQVVPNPGGYLTPCTQNPAGTPITGCTAGQLLPSGDVTGATTLFYTPVASGAQIPIWNGSQYVPFQFSELTLTLGSSNLANTAYDVCIFNNAGAPTAVTSVAWSSSSAGSSARGTGAGTAQISRTNGFWTNAVAITGRNGANTYSIPANQCTIVSSLYMDSSNGAVSFSTNIGQSRKWSSYNFYNEQPILLRMSAPSAISINGTFSIRNLNSDAANSITTFSGYPSSPIVVSYSLQWYVNTNCNAASYQLQYISSIGINSNSATNGQYATASAGCSNSNNAGSVDYAGGVLSSNTVIKSPIGPNVINALESNTRQAGNFGTVNVDGSPNSMLLTASWRG